VEEEARQLVLLQLQSHARDASDELGLLKQVRRGHVPGDAVGTLRRLLLTFVLCWWWWQEVELLRHMASLRDAQNDQRRAGPGPGPGSSSNNTSAGDGRDGRYPAVPGLPSRVDPPVGGEGLGGLDVTRASKIGDQVVLRWPLTPISFLPSLPFCCLLPGCYYFSHTHTFPFHCLRVSVGRCSRETVRSTVFRDSIAPPTMTLEEYGDIQKAEALARAQQ